MLGKPVVGDLLGHRFAVRRIVWSPHWQDVLLSTSYDTTVRVRSGGSVGGMTSGVGRMMDVMELQRGPNGVLLFMIWLDMAK
jgi:hypothetical protein